MNLIEYREIQWTEIRRENNEKTMAQFTNLLSQSLEKLETLADPLNIPETSTWKPTMPIQINELTIEDQSFRHYLIIKYIRSAKRVLFKIQDIPSRNFNGIHVAEVLYNHRSIENLIPLLKGVPNL